MTVPRSLTEATRITGPARRSADWPHSIVRDACDLEIIVPAYNEEHRISSSLRAIVAHLAGRTDLRTGVVVVDNGSSDRTAELVDGLVTDDRVPVTVIGCSEAGKGAAVRRGISTSRARYVGFCDADLATPIEAIEDVLRELEAGSPVVIGSRRVDGATYAVPQTRRRRVGGWLFRRQTRDLSGGVSDTQCGFKFFHLAAAHQLFHDIHTTGFVFDLELIARARAAGLPVTEVPVDWSDVDGSSLNPLRDGPTIAADLRLIRSKYPSATARPAGAGHGPT